MHYIPVQVDLSDLADSLTFFRGDPNGDGAYEDLAKRIASACVEQALKVEGEYSSREGRFRCVDGCISLGAWIGLEVWRLLDVGVFFLLRNEREDTGLLAD